MANQLGKEELARKCPVLGTFLGTQRTCCVQSLGLIFAVCIAASPAGKDANCCGLDSDTKPILGASLELPQPTPDKGCDWNSDYPAQIVFTQQDRIVVGSHADCIAPDAAVPIKRSHTFDVIAQIESASGKLLKSITSLDASIDRQYAEEMQLIATTDGKFLARVGPFLKLFSPELKELKSRELPVNVTNGDHNDYWAVHVSPDGHSGLLQHWSKRFQEDHWFSTDTLEDMFTEAAPLDELWRSTVVNDNALYYPAIPPPASRSGAEPPVYVRKQGESKGHQIGADCYGLPKAVVPNGLIIISQGRASFLLARPDGTVVDRESYGSPIEDIGHVTTSNRTNRFAFTFGHLQKRILSYKAEVRIVVFDADAMKAVLKIKANQSPQNLGVGESWPGVSLALSPDGKRLAALSGSVLKVFEVP